MPSARRVPWRDAADLDLLSHLVYSDSPQHRRTAINRLIAWQAVAPLPQALEAVLSIIVVQNADSLNERAPGSELRLRQEYSLAILRAVNGLVDPLQDGLFARSVASIAAQIGLPNWLIELRHASTHEDLPSLDILRHAANEILKWCHDNFFTLSRSRFTQPPQPLDLASLKAWLQQYKPLALDMASDESLRSRRHNDMRQLLRNLERWLASAEAHAESNSDGMASTSYGIDDSIASGEIVALEALCSVLLLKGNLGADKNELLPKQKNQKIPSNLPVWLPLLRNVQANRPNFFGILMDLICRHLSGASASPLGHDDTIILWATWILSEESSATVHSAVADNVLRCLQESGTLSQSLSRVVDQLPHEISCAIPRSLDDADRDWNSKDLGNMAGRLDVLRTERTEALREKSDAPSAGTGELLQDETVAASTPGWTRLRAGINWQPCPLGMLRPTGAR